MALVSWSHISASICVSLCVFKCTDTHLWCSVCVCVCVWLWACACLHLGKLAEAARRNMTSVPSLLWGVLRQSGETGLQMIGPGGVLGGHVPLLSHVALGTVAGEWQAGEENTTHSSTVGVGAGCAGWLQSWRSFPGLYQTERIKRKERDLPQTIRGVSTPFVCATERERGKDTFVHIYSRYVCGIYRDNDKPNVHFFCKCIKRITK